MAGDGGGGSGARLLPIVDLQRTAHLPKSLSLAFIPEICGIVEDDKKLASPESARQLMNALRLRLSRP